MSHGDGLRIAILDDAPYVSYEGQVHAMNATFHRFAAGLLDVPGPDGAPRVSRVVLAAQVRPVAEAPATLPVDPRIRVVATEPFDGIAGYLRRAPVLAARNLPHLRRAFAGVDVVLLRLPASNGPVAATLALLMRRPRVAYVVGSVGDVAAGQGRTGAAALGARAVGILYDTATRLAGLGAETIVVGRNPAGGGIISSLVTPDEIRPPVGDGPWPASPRALRLVFAGRLVPGKGIEDLLAAVARLAAADEGRPGLDITLDLVGDGPGRADLEREAASLGIIGRVSFAGYIAERVPYLERLGRADLFVSASPAEGFPKAVLDAMAVGLPVIAVPAGELASLAGAGANSAGPAILPAGAGAPVALAATIERLAADPAAARGLREAGRAFVEAHTLPAEAERLVEALERAAGRG
jgi:glycosyltransferase involved in cell wall biosynthesis